MPRRLRFGSAGYVYHVLNRGVGRSTIFEHADDYLAFERVLQEAQEWLPMRLLSYSLMPNHWHLVVRPHKDGDLSEWMRWVTVTHTQRWHGKHKTLGTGPLYQGRFKSFPIQRKGVGSFFMKHSWPLFSPRPLYSHLPCTHRLAAVFFSSFTVTGARILLR